MIVCETVTAELTENETGYVVSYVLPAYTVEPEELEARIRVLTRRYLRESASSRTSVSLADFTLYVLKQAAADPRTIE